jgi:hypothetical protein
MPLPKPLVPPAAQPKFGAHFDAWNSSATGHQRAENRLGGSTGWRQSRATKLSYQFKSGGTGGKRISDQVGAGSEYWDKKAKALIPKDVRERAKVSVEDMLKGKGKSKASLNYSLIRENAHLSDSDHDRRREVSGAKGKRRPPKGRGETKPKETDFRRTCDLHQWQHLSINIGSQTQTLTCRKWCAYVVASWKEASHPRHFGKTFWISRNWGWWWTGRNKN